MKYKFHNRTPPNITTYDGADNVLANAGGKALTFGYDPVNRLTEANDPRKGSYGSLSYLYDANGNRTAETRNGVDTLYQYLYGDNRLTQVGSEYRFLDSAGNTTYISSLGFLAYDGYGRMTSALSGAASYNYNAFNQRIKKTAGGVATSFHYGPQGELLYETDGTNTQAYVYLDGVPLARIDDNTDIYYYHTDYLGTPQQMTNGSGTTVWRASYEPFGRATITTQTITNNVRLDGYWDQETSLYYVWHRYYDPKTGRWISSDPIGLAGGLNTYAYVENNPLRWTDPDGLKTYRCTKPLDALKKKFSPEVSEWAYKNAPYSYHQYSCVVDKKGKVTCGGQDYAKSPIYGPGKPSEDSYNSGRCEETQPDNDCFEKCLVDEWAKPRPNYGIPVGADCQEYDDDVNQRCRKQCKIKK